MKIHPRLTPALIADAVRRQQFDLDDPGFCIACGHEQDGVEPDALRYECEACGERTVYGAQELALRTFAV